MAGSSAGPDKGSAGMRPISLFVPVWQTNRKSGSPSSKYQTGNWADIS